MGWGNTSNLPRSEEKMHLEDLQSCRDGLRQWYPGLLFQREPTETYRFSPNSETRANVCNQRLSCADGGENEQHGV